MRRIEGWSLIELILVIVVLGILAAFAGPVLLNAVRAYDTTQAAIATHAKMRYAVERMAREVREVRRQTTDAAFLDFTSMTAASMAFFKTDGTQVILNAAGTNVQLSYVGTAGAVLTDQVQAGSFAVAYLQQDTVTPAATAASISFIQINLALTDGTNVFPGRVRVDLRNPQ